MKPFCCWKTRNIFNLYTKLMCAARVSPLRQECCGCKLELEYSSFRKLVHNFVRKSLRKCRECEESDQQPLGRFPAAFVTGDDHFAVDFIVDQCPTFSESLDMETRDTDIRAAARIAATIRTMDRANITTANERDAVRLGVIRTYLSAFRELVPEPGFPPLRYNDIRTILSNQALPPDDRGRQICLGR
jgi:hypothetical protein